jgi:hypothetical protein
MSYPNGITPWLFEKYCNSWGGRAFRDDVLLMKHHGVFVGFNYRQEWIELASSDPTAEWKLGCQDSCVRGNPRPYSKTAYLLPIDRLPAAAQPLARQWVAEAIELARAKIEAGKKEERNRDEANRREREQNYHRQVVEPWCKVVAEHSHEAGNHK